MNGRSLFEPKKRENALPSALPVKIKVSCYHTRTLVPIDEQDTFGMDSCTYKFDVTSKEELESVVAKLIRINLNNRQVPGRGQQMVIKATGTVGEAVINIDAGNLLEFTQLVTKIEFTEATYEPWAYTLRTRLL